MLERNYNHTRKDINQLAASIVDEAAPSKEEGGTVDSSVADEYVERPGKNPHAVALGRQGGLKGGKARAAKLTSEQRKEIARKAAQARWQRRDGKDNP